MTLFLDPHSDDLALFCAFTLQRHPDAQVCVVFDSYVQPARGIPGCDAETRRTECTKAISLLKHRGDIRYLGFHDGEPIEAFAISEVLKELYPDPERIWLPQYEHKGHQHHNTVAIAAGIAYGLGPSRSWYLTYTHSGGKSRGGTEVLPRSAEEIERKLLALSCFKSQMQMDPRQGTAEWFYANDFREYIIE